MQPTIREKIYCSTFSRSYPACKDVVADILVDEEIDTPRLAGATFEISGSAIDRLQTPATVQIVLPFFCRIKNIGKKEPLTSIAVGPATSGSIITTVVGMPLGRYFAVVGSVLLALLFLADWYMPGPASQPAGGGVDKAVIRIHSRHRWPERVVIDTSLPTIVPPLAVAANVIPISQPPARRPLDALARVTPEVQPRLVPPPAVAQRPVRKGRTKTARGAAGHVAGHIASYGASYGTTGFGEAWPASW